MKEQRKTGKKTRPTCRGARIQRDGNPKTRKKENDTDLQRCVVLIWYAAVSKKKEKRYHSATMSNG